MKILITGALGHIGSKLLLELPKKFKRSKITLVDNLLTNRYCSLFNLSNKYKFINIDVTNNSQELINLIKNQDFVIHLAAITDASSSFKNSKVVEENNLQSTKNIANICAQAGASLIFISSTSVYGSQSKLVDENCKIDELSPQSPYAETKLKEEKVIKRLVKHKGLKAVICRFGTIYGISKGMRFHTAVNKFCWQAAMNEPITVWKTALNQKRPYLYIDDAINTIVHLISKKIFNGDIYNILTENLTVQEVIKEIKRYYKKINVIFVNHKIMNQLSYEVDSSKIKKTGFKFTGNIKKGISETIDLLKNSNKLN